MILHEICVIKHSTTERAVDERNDHIEKKYVIYVYQCIKSEK